MSTSLESAAGTPAVKWEPLSFGGRSSSKRKASRASIVARLIGYTEEYWPQIQADGIGDSDKEFDTLGELLDMVQEATGVAARELNPAMVFRRVGWRMRLNGVDDLASYKALLENHPTELPALRKSLFIRVTDFFKDPALYFELENTLIPEMLEQAGEQGIRVLVHGCHTGEEAYSMAILLDTFLKKQKRHLPVRILANDADKNALIAARRGFYPHLITADLSALCLDQFFEATKDGYCVIERIRKMVGSCRVMPMTLPHLPISICSSVGILFYSGMNP